jgi:hypothetical protein
MEMIDGIPVFEIVINEDDETTGMLKNSFVANPAVQIERIAFSKTEPRRMVFAHPSNSQCFMSVSILCDVPIIRRDDNGKEFFVVFKKDTIRKINNKLFKENKIHEVTMYHDDSKKVDGVYLVESFISDKKRVYSPMFDVPDGSLIQTYYVEDATKYEELLNDENFNGYSIEINASIQEMFSFAVNEAVKESKIKEIVFHETMSDKEKEIAIKSLLNL